MPKVKLPLQGNIVADLPFAVATNLVKRGQASYVEEDTEEGMTLSAKDAGEAPENKAMSGPGSDKKKKAKGKGKKQ